MSVSYTATLPVRDQTVLYLSSLLHAERVRRGTRTGSRVLTPFNQAILVLRWFLDATRVRQMAIDNAIGKSTVYTYLHEGFTVLAAEAPALESALLAAKMAGHSHVSIDGTLIETNRPERREADPGGVRLVTLGQQTLPTSRVRQHVSASTGTRKEVPEFVEQRCQPLAQPASASGSALLGRCRGSGDVQRVLLPHDLGDQVVLRLILGMGRRVHLAGGTPLLGLRDQRGQTLLEV